MTSATILINGIMRDAREAMLDYDEVNEDEFFADFARIVLQEEADRYDPSVVNEIKEWFGI